MISGVKITIHGPARNCVGFTAIDFSRSSGKSLTILGSLIVKIRLFMAAYEDKIVLIFL